MSSTLSLCMIVKDEERNLGRCLASVEGGVDEIIVCDTGSKDRTIAIAKEHGAIVVERAWTNDFAAARNFAIDHATKDWIFILDADETVDAAWRPRLRAEIATDAAALRVRTRSMLPPGEVALYTDLVQTRLFVNRPEHRYVGAIHEQITASIQGKLADSEILVVHHGYQSSTAQGEDRGARNLGLLEEQHAKHPDDAFVLYNLGATHKNLGHAAEARRFLELAEERDRGSLPAGIRARLHMTLAQLALAAHEDALASAYAQKTLAVDPENPLGLQILALGLLATNDLPGAIAAFRKLRSSPAVAPALRADIDRILASLGA